MEWLDWILWSNPIRAWLLMVGVVVGTLLLIALFRRFFKPRLLTAHETETPVDDFLLQLTRRTRLSLLGLIIAFFATRPLELPSLGDRTIRSFALIAAIIQVGLWGMSTIEFWLDRYRHKRLESDAAAVTTLSAVGFMAKIALWILLLLLGLDNLGIEVTPLIAGVGIGGVAIALATQSILGDLFASLSIVIDKPFIIGDFIIVGDFLGTVEHIGLKTTRVRSLSGEQLVFSNSDLLQSRIRNFKRMNERRIVFSFGVVYQTPATQLEAIPLLVREIVKAQDGTRLDRVHFKGFGPFALDFEVVYYMLQPDYNLFMDTQQKINLAIVRRFERERISFAYPTQTLYIQKAAGEATVLPAME